MESRKIVQINVFAGKEQRLRCRQQVCGHREGRGGWGELSSTDIYIYTTRGEIDS